MKTVAAGDEIAIETLGLAIPLERNERSVSVEVVHADVRRLEQNLPAGRQPRRDQVPYDLMLAVNGDVFAGQPEQLDPMIEAVPANVDAIMTHALGLHPGADAAVDQQPGDGMLQHAGGIRFSQYSRERASRITESMPFKCSRCDSSNPAGPAPTMPIRYA